MSKITLDEWRKDVSKHKKIQITSIDQLVDFEETSDELMDYFMEHAFAYKWNAGSQTFIQQLLIKIAYMKKELEDLKQA